MVTTTKREEVISDFIQIKREKITLAVIGDTPLICNRMSEKARRELLLPSGRKNTAERASSLKHDPLAEYRASPYIRRNGPTAIALMSSSFKGAMGTAALDTPGATKSQIGRLTYVLEDYVHIFGVPKLFMSVTRSADINRTPDIRTRAIVPEWACLLSISFASPLIKATAVMSLIGTSGITCGVGDWRPEKGKGSYGSFTIVPVDDPTFKQRVEMGGRNAQLAALADPDYYDEETEDLMKWYLSTATQRGFAPTTNTDPFTLHEEGGYRAEQPLLEALKNELAEAKA